MHRAKKRAFTLVELLIVIAIIAVLLGVLLPALGRARELSKRTVCLSNIRQLQAAWLSYAYANNGRFATARMNVIGSMVMRNNNGLLYKDESAWLSPKPDYSNLDWQNSRLWPYLKDQRVYWCPNDPRDHDHPMGAQGGIGIGFTERQFVSYVMNGFFGELTIFENNVTAIWGTKMTVLGQIKHPSATLVFTEANPEASYYSFFWPPVYSPASGGQMTAAGLERDIGFPAHFHLNRSRAEGCTMSFADGHAIFWQYVPDHQVMTTMALGTSDPVPTPFSGNDKRQLDAWSGGPMPPGVIP